MTLILVTAPAVEPITLAQAREWLKLDTSGSPAANADDDIVEALITTVREHVEKVAGRALCTQTWDLMLDEFPADKFGYDASIKIPLPPLQYVNFIQYLDADGVWQTLAASAYQVTGGGAFRPAKVQPAYGQSWPDTRDQPEAVRLRFTAGYLDNSSPGDTQEGVPGPLKTAIRASLAHFYENRGDKGVELPDQAAALVASYRIGMFA